MAVAKLRALLFLFAGLLTLAALQPRFSLALALKPGDRLIEHRFVDDRIEWKLPKKRLEPFKRAGVVIQEERHISSVVRASVIDVRHGVATLSGTAAVSDVDVPRNRRRDFQQQFTGRLTPANESPQSGLPNIEDTLMEGLPPQPIRPGECWTSIRAVMTSLGSGRVTIRHCLSSRDGNLLYIRVDGTGAITGKEYHLLKLLPGSIEFDGAAWYDLAQRLVTLESYRVHNRLLRPAEHEQIGFDEVMDVDISTRRGSD